MGDMGFTVSFISYFYLLDKRRREEAAKAGDTCAPLAASNVKQVMKPFHQFHAGQNVSWDCAGAFKQPGEKTFEP